MTVFKPLGAALIAAAALGSAPAAAQVAIPVPMQTVTGTLLDVSAEGRVTRVPDIALVRAGVVTQGPTAAEASRANAERMAAVVAALRRAGIAERDVQTAQIQLQPRYQYGENQPPVITGYQASASAEVRFRDVRNAGSVVDALVQAGANQVDGPTLTVDDREEALDEARTAAVARARERAELYARAAGLRVARILSISEAGSVPPPMPMYAMARNVASDSAIEIMPGEQELTVTLSVRFELQ